MPSTSRFSTAYAARTLFLLSMSAPSVYAGLSAMTYKGCYSASSPLSNQGSYTYQTSGYCQGICVKKNQAVLGLSQGSQCWCGDLIPSLDDKVPDSNCNDPCQGYDSDKCGGNGYWTVYLTGTEDNVGYEGGGKPSGNSGGGGGGSGSSETSSSSPTTTAAPSIVTSISPGKTVIITRPAAGAEGSSTALPTPSSSSKSGGTNTAAVAAGVVVGVVALTAIIAGIFFFLRWKRRKAAEDEYTRSNQVADFMRGSTASKPPPTGYSSMSDSRLDPEAGAKRNSQGSIADDQDFSRRILRVANPDHGG